MRRLHPLAGIAVAALAATTLAAPTQAASPASKPLGTTSLAEVLAADGNRFDGNWDDFDIADRAVRAVLKANPSSPVAAVADGKVALTAFVPTDRAFRLLVKDVTGKRPMKEKAAFAALKRKFGLDTLESVLLYHVVPGATITASDALKSDGAELTTAAGAPITVAVAKGKVRLVDADSNDRDGTVILADVNKGNRQIAHGVDRVLRPLDL